ncbi:MAG: diheme cytochrome c [Hydrogenophaga sp.]|uniref:diheme cytochrome c n=1 Tax=Hydrogenophaga sp. TaxID=1904254 RepID=UPI003D9BD6A5
MNTPLIPRLVLLAAGLVTLGNALADGGRAMPAVVPPAYTAECAACHTAYPPSLLPARSWQRIMTGLDQHYGTDASLDAATVKQIGGWLQANAGTYKRVTEEPPQDRITRSAWFVRKHDEVEPSVWKLPSVKSAANCAACHTGADKGQFDEHNLRMPAGMTLRQRWAWRD